VTTTRTRARWRRRATVLLLVGAVGVLWLWQRAEPIDLPWGDGGEPPAPSTSSDWEVVSVTDGDTLVVSQGGTEERVRLLGIDTPEVDDCGYAEATAAMAALVEGAEVTLVVGNSNDRDQYGRLLRYVEMGVPGGGRRRRATAARERPRGRDLRLADRLPTARPGGRLHRRRRGSPGPLSGHAHALRRMNAAEGSYAIGRCGPWADA